MSICIETNFDSHAVLVRKYKIHIAHRPSKMINANAEPERQDSLFFYWDYYSGGRERQHGAQFGAECTDQIGSKSIIHFLRKK